MLCGFKWQVSLLGVWQRIEFGADRDGGTGFAPAQHGHHARPADWRTDLEAESARACGDVGTGLEFAIRELGVLVDVASVFDHLVGAPGHQLVETVVQRVSIIDGMEDGFRLWEGATSVRVLRGLSVRRRHHGKHALHHSDEYLHG